ncbi:acyl-CoA thioesterase [Pseudofrankia saprophytica]|uniref:acyl-CoA thioesterase n=1 Tax=Pseudofrankia saprophytica TaxID=298655 RepID=UPI000234C2F4|nr:acyl-CoA thioesterase domain-containing protein [Pseudofrankia saprophytica]
MGTSTVGAQDTATAGPAGGLAGPPAAALVPPEVSAQAPTELPPDAFPSTESELFDLADVLRVLDLAGDATPPLPARTLRSLHGGVLASQQLAQQIVLAERLAPGRSTQTLHTVFPNPSRWDEPLDVDVEWLQSGRTFANLALTFRQGGRAISRGDVLLGSDAPDFVRHEAAPPEPTASPAAARPVDYPLLPWEVRLSPGPAPYSLDVWQRIPGVPADPALARGLLAFASEPWAGHHVINSHFQRGTATLAPGERLAAAVLAQTVTFVEDLDVREWHLLRVESPHAGHGRFLGRGRVHTADGRLCAVFECLGMLRALPARPADASPGVLT